MLIKSFLSRHDIQNNVEIFCIEVINYNISTAVKYNL